MRRGLAARPDPELGEDRRDVVLDGLARQEQPLRDVAIAQALGDQREDIELARGEVGGVLAGRTARAAREATRAALAQLAGDHRGRAARAEREQLLVAAPLRR